MVSGSTLIIEPKNWDTKITSAIGRTLLFGVLVSAVIETSQLVFMRGLFEWDDMIHNGLGCMIGSMIINFFMKNKIRD